MQEILVNQSFGPLSIPATDTLGFTTPSTAIPIGRDIAKVRIRGVGATWTADDNSGSIALSENTVGVELYDAGQNLLATLQLSAATPVQSPTAAISATAAEGTGTLEMSPQSLQGGSVIGSIKLFAAALLDNGDAVNPHTITTKLTGLVDLITFADLEAE